MPKILQINTTISRNATAFIADSIGNLVIAEGWDSYIAFGRRAAPSQSTLLQIGSKFSIAWHVLLTRLFDRHGLGSVIATKRLIKQMKKIQPDIVHLHNIHGYFLNYKILFRFLAKENIPVVWTLHDCWSITGHCPHFEYVKCEKWKTGCYKCPQTKEYPASYFIDSSQSNYQLKKQLFNSVKNMHLVPVSDWLKNILQASFLQNHPICRIYNGIDLDIFYPQKDLSLAKQLIEKKEDSFVILGISSSWQSRKGFEDFIALRKQLDDSFIIVMVGLTANEMQMLPANIIGLEKIHNMQQLGQIYAMADVLVNPTWEDTFPTINLEALACGTPVITYKTGGSVEAVSEKTGFIVEQGNITGLADAVQQIKTQGKAYYSEACVQKAQFSYNKNERFKEYITLYQEILQDN